MIAMVAEQKSHICLEDDNISATDTYFNLQSIYNRCLEDEKMPKKIMICQTCGETFEDYPHNRSKYCSRKCSGVASAANPSRTVFKKGLIPWNKGIKWSDMCGDKNPAKRSEVRQKIALSKIGNKAKLGYKLSEGSIKKISDAKMGSKNPMFGQHYSEDRRKQSSMAGVNHPLYGTHRSQETKEKISNTNKGRTSPFKGTINRHSEVTKEHMSRGRKGRPPWNNGLTAEDDDRILQGSNNPMYGKHHSEQTLVMMRARIISEETRKKQSECRIGKYTGENHPMWRGGVSFEPYCHKFNYQLKEAVRNRDNKTCQLCDEKENGVRMSVHHIHYDKENCYPDLITLCRRCNSKVNKKRMIKYYEELFMNKLNKKGLLFWVHRQDPMFLREAV